MLAPFPSFKALQATAEQKEGSGETVPKGNTEPGLLINQDTEERGRGQEVSITLPPAPGQSAIPPTRPMQGNRRKP